MSATFPEIIATCSRKRLWRVHDPDADGGPQTTPVWIDWQDGEIWVNSPWGAEGRNVGVTRASRRCHGSGESVSATSRCAGG